MKDFEVLSFIRDEMLSNPSQDAQFVWMAANLAEKDDKLYNLMIDWAKDRSDDVEEAIASRVDYILTMDDLL